MGYVIQQVGLVPHHSILTNVATVPTLLGWDKSRSRARAEELLALVGLDPATYAGRYPHQLSGGQRQRVGVARALAADPPVLLMDEPFGAVDPVVRKRLQDEFARIARDLDKTVLFVTHDMDEALRLGDKVAVFATGGRLAQYDVPARILGRPADDFVAEFVGAASGLRRLSVTPISRADLEPLEARSAEAVRDTLPVQATLEDALATILRHDDGVVAVTDDGVPIGILTPDSVHGALRRSVRAD
jgi:osmoprotectant transport system ATP-binding protein